MSGAPWILKLVSTDGRRHGLGCVIARYASERGAISGGEDFYKARLCDEFRVMHETSLRALAHADDD